MKKGFRLFGKKNKKTRQRDEIIDLDKEYENDSSDDYDEDDYPDEEFEEVYGDNGKESQEDYPEEEPAEGLTDEREEDYPEEEPIEETSDDREENAPEDEKNYEEGYLEEDDNYPGDEPADESAEDYPEDEPADDYPEEEDYPEEVADDVPQLVRGNDRRRRKRSRRRKAGKPSAGAGAAALEVLSKAKKAVVSFGGKAADAVGNASLAERAAAIFAVVIVAGGIATFAFYSQALSKAEEIGAFAEVGADLDTDSVVGSVGLLAVADAERAKALAAGMLEEEEEEEETVDEVKDVTVKMTLQTIKSDMKIKFINSDSGKLIASVPFVVTVVTPDGTSVTYDDHDQDGIIYKNNLTAGKYKITPSALPADFSEYTIDTSAQTLTIKDTVEMKAVDVSNEIKKESQVNAAVEDTAVAQVVESALTDTVEWVESSKTAVDGDGDGDYTYEKVDRNTISDPSSTSMTVTGSLKSYAASNPILLYKRMFISDNARSDAGSVTAHTTGANGPQLPITGISRLSSVMAKTTDESVSASTDAGNEPDSSSPELAAENEDDNENLSEDDSDDSSSSDSESDESSDGSSEKSDDNSSSEGSSKDDGSSEASSKDDSSSEASSKDEGSSDSSTKDNSSESDSKEYSTDEEKLKMSASKVTVVQGESVKVSPKDSSLDVDYDSDDEDIATVSDGKIKGEKAGKTTVWASCWGYKDASIEVTVLSKSTVLKDKNGKTVYVKDDDEYREATYEDYYSDRTLYIRNSATNYKYTGWQTIDGKTYYYDKNGNYVTGEQVIQGAKYTFGSDGALGSSSGSMGIDVSKWNGNINWSQVKNSGVNFVIIRCGYRGSSAGALIEDPKFRTNIQGAAAAGLKVGVYFFTQAVNEVEAVEEASMVISLIKGYNVSFPVYLDVEASNGRGDAISASQRTANIKAFCGTIQNAGYRAGVYANKTWFTTHINTGSITNYKIWLAQYASSVTYTGSRYDMWQYTSKGSVAGISGNVDMNILYN
ncbi:MAG: hypothetical protein IJ695_06190 [Butyrivibrio sp.]|nr:hypothetical protein [Butyrivibrio sp.]